MEYVFGTTTRNGELVENLKTVGDEHSQFTGQTTTKREYTDCDITDTFIVAEKYHSDEVDGKCYDWYLIKNHSRSIDTYAANKDEVDSKLNTNDEALVELAQLVTDTNDALVELAALIS